MHVIAFAETVGFYEQTCDTAHTLCHPTLSPAAPTLIAKALKAYCHITRVTTIACVLLQTRRPSLAW